ncbi:hypothetical protein ACFQHO_20940 [Actinomadura yumaensis]|nr:hypothetical protein [Actinomadura sp. J1-007]
MRIESKAHSDLYAEDQIAAYQERYARFLWPSATQTRTSAPRDPVR